MVSSALNLDLEELLSTLERIRLAYTDDPEYQKARAELPAHWPL